MEIFNEYGNRREHKYLHKFAALLFFSLKAIESIAIILKHADSLNCISASCK